MDEDRIHMNEKILKLTLEIIYLLTGEDYAPINSSSLHVTKSSISHKFARSCRAKSLTTDHSSSKVHERKDDEKILELTNKIIHLLTGEVPIRYEDIMVSFTMEEWEYVEGHMDLYKYVLMEDQDLNISKEFHREDTEVKDEQGLPSPPCINKDANAIQAKAGKKASNWRKSRKRRAKYITKHKDKHGSLKVMPTYDKPLEISATARESSTKEGGNFTIDASSTRNPCLSNEVKPANNETYTTTDQTQGKNASCHTKEQLSCTGGNSIGDNVDVKPNHPEFSSCMREPPVDAFTAISYTQEQYDSTPIKEEAVPTETDGYRPTQYPSTHNREQSWQKTNDTGANIHAVDHTQYTVAHIKQESVLCEEAENNLNSSFYITDQHMQTRYTRRQVKVEPNSHEEGYEIYIPTDCTQRLHTLAPGQAMNRLKDAAKTNKRFTASKYRDWNRTPKNTPCMNRQTAQVVDGMYVCSTCEKSFTSHFGLVKHQTIHNGNKVSCPQCGKLFFYKSSLVIHQRIHTGEKLFACSVCNKCFTNNSNLVVHQRIHTGEKPFVCLECGKRFGHKGHLNRHLRTHETEKPATNIENYVNNSFQDHWNSHKINGWTHNIYDAGPYSTYHKSV